MDWIKGIIIRININKENWNKERIRKFINKRVR